MDLFKLHEPFSEDAIEWRISQCGKTKHGIWANCLAYITGRAIMDRLDAVVGPENWTVAYHIEASQGSTPGVVCALSIRTGGDWITKEDGAEQTDIESFKGGMSSALKRAGVAWGIGRYLYQLDVGRAEIVSQDVQGARWAKTREGDVFHWLPPRLPESALPKTDTPKTTPPVARSTEIEWVIPVGQFTGKTLSFMSPTDAANYAKSLALKAHTADKKLEGHWADLYSRLTSYAIKGGVSL